MPIYKHRFGRAAKTAGIAAVVAAVAVHARYLVRANEQAHGDAASGVGAESWRALVRIGLVAYHVSHQALHARVCQLVTDPSTLGFVQEEFEHDGEVVRAAGPLRVQSGDFRCSKAV